MYTYKHISQMQQALLNSKELSALCVPSRIFYKHTAQFHTAGAK